MSDAATSPPGHVVYSDMLDRLMLRFPDVPAYRVESIVHHEYEIITGGIPIYVPATVEEGSTERLARIGAAAGPDAEEPDAESRALI